MDVTKNEPQGAPCIIRLRDYTPPAFTVEALDLTLELDAADTEVTARMSLRRHANATATDALVLDGQALELREVRIDGALLAEGDYELDTTSLTLRDVPDAFELQIRTHVHPDRNTALEGLYLSGAMLCTQCEAEGFRRITYFPDRPDVMTTYSVTLIAARDRYPVLLSNGNLVEHGDYDEGRHFARWHDPFPKPSYLFAVVAGDLHCKEDRFVTRSGREVALRIYVEKENRHKCDHALVSLRQAMRWDEQVYGREYDLDIFNIVAVNDFNMGAMENKSLNIFNAACVLASPETATDDDYYNIQSIIGHEYFHNWSGNRVTCRDWFQLSLKEGFTVFRDQQFSADLNSAPVKRIDDVNVLRTHQFAQDAGPMAHPVRPAEYMEISNFYTVTVYNKGAEVVRMLHTLLGEKRFRTGTDLYFARHDGQAVTTDDFVAALEDATGEDLAQFRRWYAQAGTPELHVSAVHDAANRTWTMRVRQHTPATPGQPDKEPLHIPLRMGLLDAQGRSLPLRLQGETGSDGPPVRVLELREAEQAFCFTDIAEPPSASLLRGFSAPVRLIMERADDELAFQLAHDTDPFNRWEAGQQLAINTMLRLIAVYREQGELQLQADFVEAFRKTLNDTRLDKAFVARALTLPVEAYLADQCEVVDVDAIHAVRQFVRREMAVAMADDLLRTCESNADSGPYTFDAAAMGQRALKNLCLAWLMELDDPAIRARCVAQFTQSHNMTDTLAALGVLVHHDLPETREALALFYDKWSHDAQVTDKWFALQAGSRLPDTLARVRELTSHPAFCLTNPNKVRALIGRFCMGNQVRFHAINGEGYALLREYVLRLDPLNPQIAARLVQALSRWRRHDARRQALMQSELDRIVEHTGLSKDVYEIASKSLA